MIEIFELEYTKAQLAKVPDEERTFFLVMTSLANDVQMLNKQMQTSIREESDIKVVQHGAHAMAMLNLRMLAGRLYEGWKTHKAHYPHISSLYDKDLKADAKSALAELEAYFEPKQIEGQPKPRRALLAMVRDKIGFHADFKMTAAAFNECKDDAIMGEYICLTMGNTLYFSTEMVHLEVVAKIENSSSDDAASLMALMDHSRDVTRLFNTFVYGFAAIFLRRHFPKKVKKLRRRRVDLPSQPKLRDLRFPFFTELE